MLRKANRLRRSWEFRRARNRGRSWGSSLLVLHVYRRSDDEIHAGFSVSKRVGKATVRNRVKRLMREGLRATLIQVKPGNDLVLTARPQARQASYGEIRYAIEDLLKRSRILEEQSRHA